MVNMGEVVVLSSLSCSGLTTGKKNITIPDIKSKEKADDWDQERFPNDDLSDTSSRDYPRLYLDSDYGQRTDRENDVETEHEMERPPVAPSRASRQNQQH